MTQRQKTIFWGALGGAVGGAILAIAMSRGVGHGAPIPMLAKDKEMAQHWEYYAAFAFWVAFSLYWEAAAKNAAAAKSAESKGSRRVHVALTNLALVLEAAPIRGLGRFVPLSWPVMLAGLGVEAVGLALAIWARRHLGRNWSGEITIKVEHQLIRSGPYRVSRHPIYTGLLTMYAGTALVTGEWLAAIGVALAVFAYWRKIRLEEANLEVAFGAEYEEYRRRTRALVPGIL